MRKRPNQVSITLDPECRMILDLMKRQSPNPNATDSQMIRYCVKQTHGNSRMKIIEKINEHSTKLDWWQEKLRLIEEKEGRKK